MAKFGFAQPNQQRCRVSYNLVMVRVSIRARIGRWNSSVRITAPTLSLGGKTCRRSSCMPGYSAPSRTSPFPKTQPSQGFMPPARLAAMGSSRTSWVTQTQFWIAVLPAPRSEVAMPRSLWPGGSEEYRSLADISTPEGKTSNVAEKDMCNVCNLVDYRIVQRHLLAPVCLEL